ncbi:disease resistance protein RPV1-like [Gastrolobium bilobum]|uniref:disease resistance protein RPV1-like n=1 Tax=Gastrolobium bilobum TaxID=150636 RepID=UPI002AAFD9E1|nr:disease resistance protein RPV1-like [Gastrolobium bilobum]
MAEGQGTSFYSTGEYAYDVFLNFRGADTREGFTSLLLNHLKERGIRTFFDEDSLRRGKQINSSLLRAIEESRVAVVVFSPNYASSKYCLDELVHILDCCKGIDRLVLPVFVDVDPSQVRHQSGAYGEALDKHEKQDHVDKQKLQRWRQALTDAADLSGWHIQQGYLANTHTINAISGQ